MLFFFQSSSLCLSLMHSKLFRNPRKESASLAFISMAASWACSRCTFLNPPSQKSTCQICLSPLASPLPSSSCSSSSASSTKWSCKACTFSNSISNNCCEICGTRALPSLLPSFEVFDCIGPEDELDSSVGSVFFPLQRCCKRKVLERSPDDSGGFGETGSSRIVKSSRNEGTFLGNGDVVEEVTTQDAGLSKLKIMTYNVWFREDLEMFERMKALGELIQQYSPDVICLQEVTPNIYSIFQKSNWWKAYCCSVSNEMSQARPYFCMQLSKIPVKSFSCKPFSNSIMGRELCVTEVEVGPGKTLVIATTHLESPCLAPPTWDQMYSKERVAQAKEALNFLNRSTNMIFAGDMNWDDNKDGQFPLPAGWTDAWTELRPSDHGFTYDTKSNKMLTGNRTLQKRLDRFFCKLHDFKVSEIDMIGLEAIPGLSYCKEKKVKQEMKKLTLPVLPSDHYGLVLTICKK